MAVSFTEVSAISMDRSQERIVADGVDNISIILNLTKPWLCEIEGKLIQVPAEFVCILDNSTPFTVRSGGGNFVIAVLPRRILDRELPRWAHGCVLHGTLDSLFADYLRALVHRLPNLVVEDAPAVMNATCDLLVGCLHALARSSTTQPSDLALLLRARQFIDRHLGSPLTVMHVARELGLSRSGFYRAFAAVGGIERFITRRRLAWAHSALLDPAGRKTIATIAHESGFSSAAHFARLFKTEYGVTPRTLRGSHHPARPIQHHADIALTYRAWTAAPTLAITRADAGTGPGRRDNSLGR